MDRDTAAPHDPAHVRQLLHIATKARGVGLRGGANVFVRDLVECDVGVVAAEVEWALLMQLTRLWEAGWQPLEVHREMRRSGSTDRRRASASWRSMPATPATPRRSSMPGGGRSSSIWARGDRPRRPGGSRVWVVAGCPGPRCSTTRSASTGCSVGCRRSRSSSHLRGRRRARARFASVPADEPVLGKVRALLAQAESTPYEAEAESVHREGAPPHGPARHRRGAPGGGVRHPGRAASHGEDPGRRSVRGRQVVAAPGGRRERPLPCGVVSRDRPVDRRRLRVRRRGGRAALHVAPRAGAGGDDRCRPDRTAWCQDAQPWVPVVLPPGVRGADRRSTGRDQRRGHGRGGGRARLGARPRPRGAGAGGGRGDRRARSRRLGDLRLRGGQDPLGWAGGRQAADLAKLNAAELHDRARRS